MTFICQRLKRVNWQDEEDASAPCNGRRLRTCQKGTCKGEGDSDGGFEYWDYSAKASFLDHPEWFNDAAHLNERGADCFTDMVIERIRKSHQSVAINN